MVKESKNKMSFSEKATKLAYERKKKKSRQKTPFLEGMKTEIKKISWTSKQELALATKIVLGSIFCLSIGIYVIDLALRGIMHGLSLLTHIIN